MADDLTTKILIEIRDEIRGTKEEVKEANRRLDATNDRLSVLAMITQGIDTRLTRMETNTGFIPGRVDVLEQKVERIEETLDIED